MAVEFNPDESAITSFLNDPYGPVGDLMGAMGDEVAMKARAMAPVRGGYQWNNSATRTSNARPPGFLKASIHGKRGVSREGNLYGSANAEADPLIFIAYPAKQVHVRNTFMTRALFSTRA
jgi:hypothetical protein